MQIERGNEEKRKKQDKYLFIFFFVFSFFWETLCFRNNRKAHTPNAIKGRDINGKNDFRDFFPFHRCAFFNFLGFPFFSPQFFFRRFMNTTPLMDLFMLSSLLDADTRTHARSHYAQQIDACFSKLVYVIISF